MNLAFTFYDDDDGDDDHNHDHEDDHDEDHDYDDDHDHDDDKPLQPAVGVCDRFSAPPSTVPHLNLVLNHHHFYHGHDEYQK